MTELSAPLVPANVDLTDFGFMPLDVRRLRDSRIAAGSSGDEFRAAVLLWCAAWHQKPAASIPDDDIEMSQLAGFGRVVKEWRKVKEGALRGWIKCSDGRLYHPVVAEKAIEAWNEKIDHGWSRECDRIRKENKRREKTQEPPLELPPRPRRISSAHLAGNTTDVQKISAGIPPENSLKGQGQGQGDSSSDPNGSAQSSAVDPLKALFDIGRQILVEAGKSDRDARSVLGKWRKDMGDDPGLLKLLIETKTNHIQDPVAYVTAAITRGRSKPGGLYGGAML